MDERPDDLGARRIDAVREHMDSENRLDFDATMATFAHPRYELVGTGQVFDGPDEVSEYFRVSRRSFPDQRNRLHSIRHADDAVFVEFDLVGTHLGAMGGLAPTGRTFTCPMAAVFEFEPGGVGIVCERVYFDQGTILRQLTG